MEVPQLQCSDKVGDVLVVQVVVGVSWKVPQIQFIARVSGPSSFQRDGKLSAVPQIQFIARVSGHCSSRQRRVRFQRGDGGDEGFFSAFLGHFSRSSRSSGVERQFSEPSIVKSSSSSRAPFASCTWESVHYFYESPVSFSIFSGRIFCAS